MIREDYFENPAGERFHFRENIPDNPKAAIIAVHGLAEHFGRYIHIEEFFASRGFSFHIMENRGHGKSVGRRIHIDRYDQFVEDLNVFRELVAARLNGIPLLGLSHSNGSLILARYALKHGDGLKGVVLSGIPISFGSKVNPIKFKAGMFLAGIVPKLTLPNTDLDPQTLCHDKKVVEDYIADPMVYKVISVGFAKQFFWAMGDLLARAPEFKIPALFQHGGDDRACSPASAREFFEKISSSDKEFILYEGLYHEIYNEPQKLEILETAANWMEKRIS
ncbi:MAG: lysophospholipase [bacterium]